MLTDTDKQNIQWLIDNAPTDKSTPEQIYEYWLRIRPIKRSLRRLKSIPTVDLLFANEDSETTTPGTFFGAEENLFVYLGPRSEKLKQEVIIGVGKLVENLNKVIG